MKDLGRTFKTQNGKVYGYLGKAHKGHACYDVEAGEIGKLKKKPVFLNSEKSQKTIDFFNEKVASSPKKGQLFVGNDGVEYYCMSTKALIIEMLSKDMKKEFKADIFFVNEVKDEIHQKIAMTFNPVNTKKAYKDLSLEDKIRTGLWSFYTSYKSFDFAEIIEVGNIIEGEAFYHEIHDEENAHYMVIGLTVKFRTKLLIGSKSFEGEPNTGFFCIYYDKKSHNSAPIDFEEGNSDDFEKAYRFDNGVGDTMRTHSTLISVEDVQKAMKNIDLDVYQIK